MKIALWGATGRLGRSIVDSFPHWQREAELTCYGRGSSAEAASKADVIIECSRDDGLSVLLDGLQGDAAIVIGSTNINPHNQKFLEQRALTHRVFAASNFSRSLALLEAFCTMVPQSFESVLIETHHEGKKDAPSGTAKTLARALQHQGLITSIRTHHDSIGEHEVRLYRDHESLEINHRITSRSVFAQGALDAAWFLVHNPHINRIVGMQDLVKNELHTDTQ